MDAGLIHAFLSEQSYWARGIPRSTVDRALAGSLCFGVFEGGRQLGFARVVTDQATVAYLADVFVLPEHRGRGLARLLLDVVHRHPGLQGLRRWILVTADAAGLYARWGWTPLAAPERWMERHDPRVYEHAKETP